jgi:hypothetical protein
MATATIILQDDPENPKGIIISADFGDVVDDSSVAHGTADQLIKAVLEQARRVETLEDTTGGEAVTKEESLIIKPE